MFNSRCPTNVLIDRCHFSMRYVPPCAFAKSCNANFRRQIALKTSEQFYDCRLSCLHVARATWASSCFISAFICRVTTTCRWRVKSTHLQHDTSGSKVVNKVCSFPLQPVDYVYSGVCLGGAYRAHRSWQNRMISRLNDILIVPWS